MTKRKKRADADTPWKKILRSYFPQAIQFFFPTVAELIDWDKPHEFLDKELQQIARDSEQGKRYVDKLVRVWLKTGQSVRLIVHVEIQAQKEDEFPDRMLTYNLRIYDREKCFATSLAILCDTNADWRPQSKLLESPATRLSFEFGVVKLLDYNWDELEASDNPMATVVMAHLKTHATKRSAKQRKIWKLSLMRRLYEQGWSRQDIRQLYEFLDWVMILPEDLEDQFWQELKQFEESRNMAYVTNAARIERRLGKQEGKEEIAREMLKEGMELETIARLTKLSTEQIQKLQTADEQDSRE